MSFREHAGRPLVVDAIAHDVTTAEGFMELLLADDEWVRREFEDIVAAGWSGSDPPRPRTPLASHEPRRTGPCRRPWRVARVRRQARHALVVVHVRGPPRGRVAVA